MGTDTIDGVKEVEAGPHRRVEKTADPGVERAVVLFDESGKFGVGEGKSGSPFFFKIGVVWPWGGGTLDAFRCIREHFGKDIVDEGLRLVDGDTVIGLDDADAKVVENGTFSSGDGKVFITFGEKPD